LMKKGAVLEGIRRWRGRDRLASVWSNGRQATSQATAWDQSVVQVPHIASMIPIRAPRPCVPPSRLRRSRTTDYGLPTTDYGLRGQWAHGPTASRLVFLSFPVPAWASSRASPLERRVARSVLSTAMGLPRSPPWLEATPAARPVGGLQSLLAPQRDRCRQGARRQRGRARRAPRSASGSVGQRAAWPSARQRAQALGCICALDPALRGAWCGRSEER